MPWEGYGSGVECKSLIFSEMMVLPAWLGRQAKHINKLITNALDSTLNVRRASGLEKDLEKWGGVVYLCR